MLLYNCKKERRLSMKNKVEVESYDNSNEVGWAIIGLLKHNSKIKDTLIQLVVENTYKVFFWFYHKMINIYS